MSIELSFLLCQFHFSPLIRFCWSATTFERFKTILVTPRYFVLSPSTFQCTFNHLYLIIFLQNWFSTHQLSLTAPAGWTHGYLWTARCHKCSQSHRIWPCRGRCSQLDAPEQCLSTWSRYPSPSMCAGFGDQAGCQGLGSELTPSSHWALRYFASYKE